MRDPIQLSYGEFRSILRRARCEAEAVAAGFVTHAEMVEEHRAARRAKLRAARMASPSPLDPVLAKIYETV